MADDIGMVLLASEAWPTASMAREVPGPARDAVATAPPRALPCCARASREGMSPQREQRTGPAKRTGHAAPRSGMLQRILDRKPFRPRRRQQGIIGGDKQGRREPAWLERLPDGERAGQMHGAIRSPRMAL